MMDPEDLDYPPDGTLDDLSITCNGDQDGLRGPLTGLKRVQNAAGKKATRARYVPIPIDDPYEPKELFFFDITTASPSQIHEITVEQLALGHALAFTGSDRAQVYIEDNPAIVVVYKEQ